MWCDQLMKDVNTIATKRRLHLSQNANANNLAKCSFQTYPKCFKKKVHMFVFREKGHICLSIIWVIASSKFCHFSKSLEKLAIYFLKSPKSAILLRAPFCFLVFYCNHFRKIAHFWFKSLNRHVVLNRLSLYNLFIYRHLLSLSLSTTHWLILMPFAFSFLKPTFSL